MMSCDDTATLLPWFLNGSLEAAERQQVADHLASCAGCREALAETRFAAAVFAAHVPSEALVAYGFGDERGLDAALVARHLERCPSCAAELALIRDSRRAADEAVVVPFRPRPEPPSAATRWRAAALAAGLVGLAIAVPGWWLTWQLNQRLAQRQEQPPAVADGTSLVADEESGRQLAALARENERLQEESASLTGELAARAARQAALEAELALLAAPELNPLVEDLLPAGLVRRGGGGDVNELELSAEARTLTLILAPPDPLPELASYEIELIDGNGTVAWRAAGLEAQRHGDFTVRLPLEGVPGERFTLKLYGRSGEERRELAEYPVSLVRPAAP